MVEREAAGSDRRHLVVPAWMDGLDGGYQLPGTVSTCAASESEGERKRANGTGRLSQPPNMPRFLLLLVQSEALVCRPL